MRKIGKLSHRWGLVCLILFVSVSLQTVKANYDSTYVLAVKQKYAIPEVVENNDDVGLWLKTYTWMSKGTITFSIEKNFRSAFSINSSSGLITISDASQINGKIVQQDTVINLIIRTTDNLIGYELDTCEIRVKEKSYCIFYNFLNTQGNGTRANPYNRFNSVAFKAGYGYFIKRGTVSDGETTKISGLISSARHPMIIAAYGKGKRPVFDGTHAPVQSQCFYFGDDENQENGRCEYIYMYDVDIKDYVWCAMEAYRTSRNLGFYNVYLHNNDINGRQSMFVISTSSYDDTASYDPFELINCEFDTVGRVTNFEPSHIKIGSGPTYITNCRFGSSARAGVRFADGNHGGVMKHCLVETGQFTNQTSYYAVQIRMDNTTIEDCRLLGGSTSVYMTAPGDANCYEMQPHHVTIKNCYMEDAVVAGIWVAPPNDQYQSSTGHIYKDNLIKNTGIGIHDRNGNGTLIQRNRIFNAKQGIYISDEWSGKGRNIKISNNLIYGCSDKAIYIANGDKYTVVRNTVNGRVDVSGATNTSVMNNFYSSLNGGGTVTRNLEIGTLTTPDYFVNFKENDYCLKTTASRAINQGVNDGITQDYAFNPVVGNPDIGAWEYVENVTENPPDPDTTSTPEPPVVVNPPSPPPIVTDGNIYIDPENTGDAMENGTKDHPYNSWQDVKWAEGKSYLQKKGTTANEDKVIIGASNVKIGSYGTGSMPRIASNTSTYLISAFEKKNISISGLQLDAPNSVSTVYFLGGTSDNITVEMCVLKGSENSIRIVDGKHFTIRYNTISSEGEGITSSALSNDLYYNIFKENEVAIMIPSVLSQARIYNNVFAGNNESISSSYADLTIYNNIFYFFENGQKAIKHLSDKVASDNNIYFPQQAGFVSIAGQSYSTLDQLQKDLKLDLNSFEKDPLFVDIFTNDFNIKNNSPAIDNGININISKDFIGTSVPYHSAPDIGIMEFTGMITNYAKSLKVYPNPSSGTLNVDFQEILENETINPQVSDISSPVLKVVDLSGRVLITKSITNTDNTVESMDLSAMANGIYMVIFERLGKTIVEKVILSR